MLCGTGCGQKVTLGAAKPDPAKLSECPRSIERPGDLPALAPFLMPDGSLAVPLNVVREREAQATQAVLLFRGAWLHCQSTVIYVEDWSARLP